MLPEELPTSKTVLACESRRKKRFCLVEDYCTLRVWKGIYGIQENAKFLNGIRDLTPFSGSGICQNLGTGCGVGKENGMMTEVRNAGLL